MDDATKTLIYRVIILFIFIPSHFFLTSPKISKKKKILLFLIIKQLAIGGVADPNDVDGDIFLTADLLRQYAVDGSYFSH